MLQLNIDFIKKLELYLSLTLVTGRVAKPGRISQCFAQAANKTLLVVSLVCESCIHKVEIPHRLSLSVYFPLCVKLSNASLKFTHVWNRKVSSSMLSLAALVGCGWVIVIATVQGIKVEAPSESRQGVSFHMISQRHIDTHARTHTHICKRHSTSTGMSELCV